MPIMKNNYIKKDHEIMNEFLFKKKEKVEEKKNKCDLDLTEYLDNYHKNIIEEVKKLQKISKDIVNKKYKELFTRKVFTISKDLNDYINIDENNFELYIGYDNKLRFPILDWNLAKFTKNIRDTDETEKFWDIYNDISKELKNHMSKDYYSIDDNGDWDSGSICLLFEKTISKDDSINDTNFDESCIIQEDTKYERKYKCPYCDEKDTKANLVVHVNDEHEEMIPKDYTASRVVYNYINKRTQGCCKFCKGETEWNEEAWKYRVICNKPSCRKKASQIAENNMKKKYGKTKSEMLKDPDRQNKMLEGRSISGVYNFKGQEKTYVGSYELKLLEFYDKVLNVSPDEIETPGPVVEYMYKGEKHFWITDLYYNTANLVHDAKDGGKNPNNREMKDYREKQNAKEKAIKDQGKYNYVRVTDNSFEQVLNILAELKQQMIDDTISEKTICHINEYMNIASINPVIGSNACIVNYGINGMYSGMAFTKDKFMSSIYLIDPVTNKVHKENDPKSFIKKYDFEMYVNHNIKDPKNIISQIESAINNNEEHELDWFYSIMTEGDRCLDPEEIQFDSRFNKELDAYTYFQLANESIKNTINYELSLINNDREKYIEETGYLPFSFESEIKEGFNLIEDIKGICIRNTKNNKVSGYFESRFDIPDEIYNILK